jgi:hypothetical protein
VATEPFDPYQAWLGIPPVEQPPDHYRLLQVALFEGDLNKIYNAANERIAMIRSHTSGPHTEQAHRLLQQITAARLCLLNPKKKAEYDASLQPSKVANEVPLPELLPAPSTPKVLPIVPSPKKKKLKKRKHEAPLAWSKVLIFAAACVPVPILLVGIWWFLGRERPTERTSVNSSVSTNSSAITQWLGSVRPLPSFPTPFNPSVDSGQLVSKPPSANEEQRISDMEFDVVQALVGTESNWADVTENIRKLVTNQRLSLTFRASLGLPDAAPNRLKVIIIHYSLNGRPRLAFCATDNAVNLPPKNVTFESVPVNGFAVIQAFFGTESSWADVTSQVRMQVKSQKLLMAFPAQGADLPKLGFPDPAPNRRKALAVLYSLDGISRLAVFGGSKEIELPPVIKRNAEPDTIATELANATETYREAAKQIHHKFVQAFDAKINEIANKGNLDSVKLIQAEKESFLGDGDLPISTTMKLPVREYLHELRNAQKDVDGVFDKAVREYTKMLALDKADLVRAERRQLLKLREDLNGSLLLAVSGKVYWIDRGRKRWVQNGQVMANLFRGEPTKADFVKEISTDWPLNESNILVRAKGEGAVYFLDQDTKRHVTSGDAMTKYHFNSDKIRTVEKMLA